jgi:hypothetical protein
MLIGKIEIADRSISRESLGRLTEDVIEFTEKSVEQKKAPIRELEVASSGIVVTITVPCARALLQNGLNFSRQISQYDWTLSAFLIRCQSFGLFDS